MYAKIFVSMYDGTLGGDWKALVTFQQLLVLCDREGVVDLTARAIAARTGIPIEIIEAGIGSLEQPDPDSRTPDREGRRIERLDAHRSWGWKIVNYTKYRELVSAEQKREADRERIAAKRAMERDGARHVAESRELSRDVANVAQAEAEAEAKAEAEEDTRPPSRTRGPLPLLHEQIIAAYHELLRDLPSVKTWPERRRKKLSARIAERVEEGKPADTVEYWRQLFGKVAASDFLMGRAKEWRCPGLEWLLEPRNFVKLIEGAYDNPRREHGVR